MNGPIIEVLRDALEADCSPAAVTEALRDAGCVIVPLIPVLPLATRLTSFAVAMVWDTYVTPEQDAEIPPSIEMRILMAILRSMAAGLAEESQ